MLRCVQFVESRHAYHSHRRVSCRTLNQRRFRGLANAFRKCGAHSNPAQPRRNGRNTASLIIRFAKKQACLSAARRTSVAKGSKAVRRSSATFDRVAGVATSIALREFSGNFFPGNRRSRSPFARGVDTSASSRLSSGLAFFGSSCRSFSSPKGEAKDPSERYPLDFDERGFR